MTETQMIARVLRGDANAFGILVQLYAPALVGTARHMTRNAEDAEDVAQEALIDAYRDLSSLQQPEKFRVWLFGILRHKCLDYLQRRQPEAIALDEYAEVIAAPAPTDNSELIELLNALPLTDREVLAARYLQELNFSEIADIMDITEEAARQRCSRARTRLRTLAEARDEERAKQLLGVFLAIPLSGSFLEKVMQDVKQQPSPAPNAIPATTKIGKLTRLKWQAVAIAGLLTICAGVCILGAVWPQTANRLRAYIFNTRTTEAQKGTTTMNKPTSVLLPNLRPMAINELGQNYLVNGFLEFQMECLSESKDYDYWFFAGVSGDAHTQIFTTDTTKGNNSLSQIDFSPQVAKTWYDAVGYDFAIVTEEQFNADRPRYVGELMKYIDRGIPVIAKHAAHKKGREMCNFVEEEFWLLVGYENGGNQLLFVTDNNRGSEKERLKVPTNQHVNYQFILPGAKKKAPALADVYRKAVLHIPALLTRPHKGDLYYGREAFDAWAKRLLAEDYVDWTDEQLDLWRLHTTYVCILATNGHCRTFLERAQKLCPDLPFLADVAKEYAEMDDMGGKIPEELQAVGGYFNITKETLRNKEAKRPIAEVIRRCATSCDRIVEIYRANGYTSDLK